MTPAMLDALKRLEAGAHLVRLPGDRWGATGDESWRIAHTAVLALAQRGLIAPAVEEESASGLRYVVEYELAP